MDRSACARSELRALLRDKGILYSTPRAPITHRTGEVSDWAFYSWNVTLTEQGLRLAARAILDALGDFGTTQLASYGYTGLPLLSACVLEGGGAYTGLSIREKRKAYLTNRRIDGVIDYAKPVVVIDDSLSSGTSLYKAISALEDEGLEVEGSIALVHFPYRGSKEWANAAGYRTVTLFDIWTDLGMADVRPPYAGSGRDRGLVSDHRMPEGLPPATLARLVAQDLLRTGRVPLWPARLDRDYDARGGTYVSFRRRCDDHRVARDGFWHFAPCDADPARDVVLATVDTLQRSEHGITPGMLEHLKIGVSFFGPLEKIGQRQLDFDRYGIVVRSDVWPSKLGGALPNTQVFISDVEQYGHARRNAQVASTEPHALYRHRITKWFESGDGWLPYGSEEDVATSWWRDHALGRWLTALARRAIAGTDEKSSGDRPAISVAIEGAAVTLYCNGTVGVAVSYATDVQQAVVAAARTACRDSRYREAIAGGTCDVAVTVSLLHHGEAIEDATRIVIERKIRRGLDAVTLRDGPARHTLLPSALVYNNWSREGFVQALASCARPAATAQTWSTHQVAAWVSVKDTVLPLRFGFPVHEVALCDLAWCGSAIDLLAEHIYRSLDVRCLPAYALAPTDRDYVRAGTAARVIHGLYALRVAGEARRQDRWTRAAARGVAYCLECVRDGTIDLPDHVGGALADTVLLAAASACGLAGGSAGARLAKRVQDLVHLSGWIGEGVKRLHLAQDQEFLPGAVVWSLATHALAIGTAMPESLAAARRFYGGRLREHPTWGCPWLAQGWSALHDLTLDPDHASIAFEAADWVGERQLDKNGAFLEDLSPDEPSFDTGFVAEGVAGAWRAARRRGEAARAARYRDSWQRACQFVGTLTLQETDTFPFHLAAGAVGGVRCTLSRSAIRVDQVSHALHALVEGFAMLVEEDAAGVL